MNIKKYFDQVSKELDSMSDDKFIQLLKDSGLKLQKKRGSKIKKTKVSIDLLKDLDKYGRCDIDSIQTEKELGNIEIFKDGEVYANCRYIGTINLDNKKI